MSSFVLKIIAVITMFIDHLGYTIFGKFSYLNYIGRISFPIFAFQISEGYIHTKSLKKYFLRLFLFALVSQIPFMLFHSIISDTFCLNIFFTLLLGLLSIYIYDKCKYKFIGILSCILLALIAQFSNCDYGAYGVAIILIFYIFKNNIFNSCIFFIFATLILRFVSWRTSSILFPSFIASVHGSLPVPSEIFWHHLLSTPAAFHIQQKAFPQSVPRTWKYPAS